MKNSILSRRMSHAGAVSAQHGFAAVSAIFLVVILAALSAFMVTFSNTQHLGVDGTMNRNRMHGSPRVAFP